MLRGVIAVCLASAVLLLIAGCGGAKSGGKQGASSTSAAAPAAVPPEQQIRQTIAAFYDATLHKDYKAICEQLLAPKLADAPEQYGRSCVSVWTKGLAGVVAPRLQVLSVRVSGDKATAKVRAEAINQPTVEEQLGFIRQGPGWRISLLK